ncbi:MAG: DNA polymerase [Selenomonadaceae bacterium]|nr:DNA polymerase [Selenomonadaceae bacterium]
MKTLSVDLETFSEIDIKKAGLYRYAENSEILLFAYAFDDEPVRVIDIAQGEEVPLDVLVALHDKNVQKTAYNAAFEIHVINHWLEEQGFTPHSLDPAQWHCTMIQGWTLGLPGGLDKIGKVLGIAEDKQKMATGKRLIQYFSKPCKPTAANGMRLRNKPGHAPEKWALFKEYCGQDVEAERAIRQRMQDFMPNDTERRLWSLDQEINDNGVLVDWDLVKEAILIDERFKAEIMAKAKALTGLANPNSNAQVLKWFTEQEGWTPETLDKTARAELQETVKSPKTKLLLQYKDLLGKTSVKKYIAMQEARCRDGRLHGMLQFYGASRTGRWAGRIVQLQNLPRNSMGDLADARELVNAGDYDCLTMLYNSPPDVLSQLIRTAFIAPPGNRFIVADFSAIEARVIAWLAGEKWRMEAFAAGKDIYCASASAMFGVPVVKHGVNGELRQKGKIAELACGYGGGVGALKAFGADKMGLSDEDMDAIVKKWRRASPHIVWLWQELEDGVRRAIRTRMEIKYRHGITFQIKKKILFIRLPSQRSIAYANPRIEREAAFDRDSITYDGTIAGAGGWGKEYTWGGKITENIVQAVARDCLGAAMLRLKAAGYKIVMHIHDEVVLEMPHGQGSLDEACAIMGEPIDWAPGLILTADGYETDETANYYRKD